MTISSAMQHIIAPPIRSCYHARYDIFSCNFPVAALAKLLISLGAGCEVRGTGGMSPLHVASSIEMASAQRRSHG